MWEAKHLWARPSPLFRLLTPQPPAPAAAAVPRHLQAQLRGLINDYQGGDEAAFAQAKGHELGGPGVQQRGSGTGQCCRRAYTRRRPGKRSTGATKKCKAGNLPNSYLSVWC